MSKARESLKALLVAKGISPMEHANTYVNTLTEVEAKQMMDAMMEVSGGRTKNLPSGEGGMIAGLRKILESRKLDAENSLPEDPYKLSRKDKAKSIAKMEQMLEESNEAFVDGIRMLLKAKSAERLDTLSAWIAELSDEDFPVAMDGLGKEAFAKDDKLAKQVDSSLSNTTKALGELAKKHRDVSDKG